ncbi:hypothetical protein EHW89_00610 [Streptococcus periodonticum]|uniref:Uncharacterized protein n=1 Tax=Streptococcus periodonticum TaxID=2490633 RepID=A0A3Q9F2E6_9STRE|nr:hypothetical protein EHW89_00610 [Streptococcus periodonticum]
MIAQSSTLGWQIKLAKQVSKLFAFQARKSTFDENFVFFICNFKQLDNCLSTLAGEGLRTKNFRFLVLPHSHYFLNQSFFKTLRGSFDTNFFECKRMCES